MLPRFRNIGFGMIQNIEISLRDYTWKLILQTRESHPIKYENRIEVMASSQNIKLYTEGLIAGGWSI